MLRRSQWKLLGALQAPELESALKELPGWSTRVSTEGKQILEKHYAFKDFREAWAFMDSLVPFINDTDHHPEWSNVYNRVHVCLTTHDVGNKISPKDVALAKKMELQCKQWLK